MSKKFSRGDRIAQELLREISSLLRTEIKDPRIGMVTLTDVEVNRDATHAKVFYTSLENRHETAEGLRHSAGFLRTLLSKRLKLRSVPQISFEYDVSVERGMQLSRLIDEAVGND